MLFKYLEASIKGLVEEVPSYNTLPMIHVLTKLAIKREPKMIFFSIKEFMLYALIINITLVKSIAGRKNLAS